MKKSVSIQTRTSPPVQNVVESVNNSAKIRKPCIFFSNFARCVCQPARYPRGVSAGLKKGPLISTRSARNDLL